MAESKVHTTSGTHDIDPVRDVIYFVDFTSGTGSATLQRRIGEGWVPIDSAYTSSMSYADISEIPEWFEAKAWRWSVTVSSGSVTTYLQPGRYDKSSR